MFSKENVGSLLYTVLKMPNILGVLKTPNDTQEICHRSGFFWTFIPLDINRTLCDKCPRWLHPRKSAQSYNFMIAIIDLSSFLSTSCIIAYVSIRSEWRTELHAMVYILLFCFSQIFELYF